MHRMAGLLLLFVPLWCLSQVPSIRETTPSVEPVSLWNAETLPWSSVLIWTERPNGSALTTGVLINKARRWVLATHHALERYKPDGTSAGIIDTVYVVWPAVQPETGEIIKTSDQYFKARREKQFKPARIIAQDPVRDIVILEAGSPAPEQCREISLELSTVPSGTKLMGIAQPFSRGGLWHPFTAQVQEVVHRRLSYTPPERRESVAIYMATGLEPAEFGYSGAPMVLPQTGKLAGLMLAAKLDNPLSFVLISSQEIQKLLPIE